MGLNSTQRAYLTDREIAFTWNGGQFVVVAWLKHRPASSLLVPVAFGLA
jgi:hypothetical protein